MPTIPTRTLIRVNELFALTGFTGEGHGPESPLTAHLALKHRLRRVHVLTAPHLLHHHLLLHGIHLLARPHLLHHLLLLLLLLLLLV